MQRLNLLGLWPSGCVAPQSQIAADMLLRQALPGRPNPGASSGHWLLFEAPVLGQHALHPMRGRVEAGLDDRLDVALPENLGDSLRDGCQPGGGAGDEDAGWAGHEEDLPCSLRW